MRTEVHSAWRKVLALVLCFTIILSVFIVVGVSIGNAAAIVKDWAPGVQFNMNDYANYSGKTYKCLLAHTAQVGWEPTSAPTLWSQETPPATATPTVTPGGPTFTPVPFPEKNIVGYYTEWSVYSAHNMYNPIDIPWEKVTHINYAFAKTTGGKIDIFDTWAATGMSLGEPYDSPYKGTYGQFKKIKQQYPKVKVLISVGGWTLSGEFHSIGLSDASRTAFADSCVEFCRKYDFDGVDIDWEYPGVPRDPDKVDNQNDTGCPAGPEDKHNMTLLLQKLREKLDAASTTDGKKYLLTIAAPAGYDKIALTEPDLYKDYLDFINLMTYDFHGAWEDTTGHLSPLYADKKNPNVTEVNQKYVTDWVVNEYLRQGLSASMLNVGIPYYSRGWQGVTGGISGYPGLYATATKGYTETYGAAGIWDGGRAAGTHPFYYIKEKLENDPSYKKYYDPDSVAPYLYNESQKLMFTYEDEKSLATKLDYIVNKKIGGAMFWEFSGDYPSKGSTMTDMIYSKFINSSPNPTNTPTPTPTPSSVTGYKVSGYVKPDLTFADDVAAELKSGFKVEVVGKDISVITDSNGYFELTSLPIGTYTFKISKANYLYREIANVTVSGNKQLSSETAPIDMWAGDVIQDNAINMQDVMEVAKSFNTTVGSEKFNANSDLNKDNAVNLSDIVVMSKHFNKAPSDYPKI